jgi:ATP-dependent protease ClpP protease subunit
MIDYDLIIAGDLDHQTLTRAWKILNGNGQELIQTLRVHLCTPGGDCAIWTALIDILSPWRDSELVTIAMGEVCSGGVPILASGTRGRRGIYRNTMIGLHEPYLSETTPDPAVQASEMRIAESMKARFYNLLAEHTDHRACWWRRRLTGQSMIWIDAKEAIKWGLADKVLG